MTLEGEYYLEMKDIIYHLECVAILMTLEGEYYKIDLNGITIDEMSQSS